MFVRFRRVAHRLQVDLETTRRVAGKVKAEHIATLGSVPLEPPVADRLAFWVQAHVRLDRLSNRIGPDMAKIIGQLHECVPMVTPDEQRQLQLENARADEKFHIELAAGNADVAEGHEKVKIVTEAAIAASRAAAAEHSERAAAARDRAARIERGERVTGGLKRPVTREDMVKALKDAGIDVAHCERVYKLQELCVAAGGEKAWKDAVRTALDDAEKARKASIRRQLRDARR
jgi:hypothetical protein